MSIPQPRAVRAVAASALAALLVSMGCASSGPQPVSDQPVSDRPESDGRVSDVAPPPAATEDLDCDDDELTGFSELLVVTPHPDDEVLGFSGLIDAYVALGKRVRVVVTSDGDAYCEACRFWKNGSTEGPTCDAAELSNFATPEIDSLAELRRSESEEGLRRLGGPAPIFLGYPDTGLRAAWANHRSGEPDRPLRRSDFSRCADCETCAGGYGEGPETELSARTLLDSLDRLIGETAPDALVATTHRLDGHGDHAGLGELVTLANSELPRPRAIAYGVIHAHTPKDHRHPDCWYPQPAAETCVCADEARALADPEWLPALRAQRQVPDRPARLPDDADYGEESQLCLDPDLWRGEEARKLAAVSAHASQLGFAARDGELAPGLGGLIDCSGYLISFVRRTEAFVLVRPERGE